MVNKSLRVQDEIQNLWICEQIKQRKNSFLFLNFNVDDFLKTIETRNEIFQIVRFILKTKSYLTDFFVA